MKRKRSVIIPVYNEEKSIGKCLDSLFKQTQAPEEFIIIDDGSTDNTLEVIKQYPVILLTQKHAGPGKARNLGAGIAKGHILVFIDADMTFARDFFEKLVAPIEAGETRGVYNSEEIVSNYDNNWAKCWNYNQGLTTNFRLNPRSRHDTEDFRAILKSEFDRVGGFDLTGYTDSRTLVRKLGYRPTEAKGAVSYHANPESLAEVFHQARWIGRRQTRFGKLGRLLNLIHYSLPYSLTAGLIKSIIYHEPYFIVFKIIYDLGFWTSSFNGLFNSSTAK